ncbi:hypothetical protein [Phaeocystidibacter luteus]|uniref:Uncharacterized protein n=1 Tax=Phaeocystidibacter luteus TaxID=911197 RepID=A0A6N6RF70_9FLAO|nr:hypothetical protein [Phaeocystidibacter luteus]KAB2809800.1 hypothetical protein F8C67_09600 [Phaeocystidibacter luteus]
MGFIGFGAVRAMQDSLKNNKALRNSNSFKREANGINLTMEKMGGMDKVASEEVLSNIRARARAERRRNATVFVGIFIVLGTVLYFVMNA